MLYKVSSFRVSGFEIKALGFGVVMAVFFFFFWGGGGGRVVLNALGLCVGIGIFWLKHCLYTEHEISKSM